MSKPALRTHGEPESHAHGSGDGGGNSGDDDKVRAAMHEARQNIATKPVGAQRMLDARRHERGPHGTCPVCRGKRSGERKSEKSDEEDEKHKIGPREQLLANAMLRSHGTASFPTRRQSRKPQATPL